MNYNTMRRMIILLGMVLVILGVGAFYFLYFQKPGGFKPAEVMIGNHKFKVEIADTLAARAQGLSDRPSLPPDAGMLFIFSNPAAQTFWMKDMRFAIDIVWIRDGKIIGWQANAQPEPDKSLFQLTRYASPGPADMVLEINTGLVEQYSIAMGDKVVVQ